jgi:nitrate/nitrite-specific signal transduction histidine kinase
MSQVSPFDITIATNELKNINKELVRLRTITSTLKKKKQEIETGIQKYLDINQHKGVMLQDVTILLEKKEKKIPIPKKEKINKIKEVLGQYVNVPDQVMQEIDKASTGKTVIKNKIVINYENIKK